MGSKIKLNSKYLSLFKYLPDYVHLKVLVCFPHCKRYQVYIIPLIINFEKWFLSNFSH